MRHRPLPPEGQFQAPIGAPASEDKDDKPAVTQSRPTSRSRPQPFVLLTKRTPSRAVSFSSGEGTPLAKSAAASTLAKGSRKRAALSAEESIMERVKRRRAAFDSSRGDDQGEEGEEELSQNETTDRNEPRRHDGNTVKMGLEACFNCNGRAKKHECAWPPAKNRCTRCVRLHYVCTPKSDGDPLKKRTNRSAAAKKRSERSKNVSGAGKVPPRILARPGGAKRGWIPPADEATLLKDAKAYLDRHTKLPRSRRELERMQRAAEWCRERCLVELKHALKNIHGLDQQLEDIEMLLDDMPLEEMPDNGEESD